MKNLLLTLLVYLHASYVFAQKPSININAISNWASIGNAAISNDGDYVFYNTYNESIGSSKLTIQSTVTNWKKEFENGFNASFTNNSKFVVFQKTADTLGILQLGSNHITYLSDVITHKISQDNQGTWLAYHLKAKDQELILRNLITNKEQIFASTTSYLLSTNGKYLLLENREERDDSTETTLKLANLLDGKKITIWSSFLPEAKLRNYAFDPNGDQLAFIVQKNKKIESENELWYHNIHSKKTIRLLNTQAITSEKGLDLAFQTPQFSQDGNLIYIGLQPIEKKNPNLDAVKVDIWSYRDNELQSLQLANTKKNSIYTAVFNLDERKLFRLEYDREAIISRGDDIVLIKRELGNYGRYEANWNEAALSTFYLVSTKDGSRKLFKEDVSSPIEDIALSPGKRWLVYYDMTEKNYFSYEIQTGASHNITKKIPTVWTDEENDNPLPPLTWASGRKTWLGQDRSLLIYDTYDIWQVDPSGIISPINLTNGIGRKQHIKFGLLIEGDDLGHIKLKNKSVLLLKAFNRINKNYEFYEKTLEVPGNPQLLSSGAYVYGWWEGYGSYNYPPIKAKNKDTYLVIRMSNLEAPNYFITNDFKKFKPLTNLQPQKSFNWLTAELINWQTPDGNISTGILYKPENFNPNNKYPIIFDCYERRSDELNIYISPSVSENRINIPFYVSNGYLIFAPDIHYKKGQPGQSAYDAISSAANYLSLLPWVDKTKMGIQGHSFGGYETNFIITKSNIFAAACAASGISNLISWYGADSRGGYPMYWAEKNQGRLGATLWEIPDLYLRNSPILNVDRVNTPLLMMQNKGDKVVPFSQGVEFFTSLRRLGKKVWMLQYDTGGHSLDDPKSALDFTIRMKQFFDHYLKGNIAPKWMTQGLPANMKGIDDGLSIDSNTTYMETGADIIISNKR